MKKQAENVIGFMVKTQLRGVRFDRPVIIHYRWIEPNRRRDKDNVAFAKKFIQDSLVRRRPGERRLEPDRGASRTTSPWTRRTPRGSDYRDIRRRKTTWQILRL